jgi:hypothetical protein
VAKSTSKEIIGWLKPKERMALLNDRALISLLVRLPIAAPPLDKGAKTEPVAALSA